MLSLRKTMVLAAVTAAFGCSQPGETQIARGNILASQRKLEEAAAAYEEGAKLAPQRTRPRELLGHIRFDQRRFDEARAAYESALQISPTTLEAKLGLARIDAEEGKVDQAIATLDSVLATQPDNLYARLSRASLSVKRGLPEDLERAIQDTAFAMRIDEKNPSVLFTRGAAFLASGDEAKALEAFELLRKSRPESPLGFYGQARVAARRGDKPQTLVLLKEAFSRSESVESWKPAEVLNDPVFQHLKSDPDFVSMVDASHAK